eukprot:357444-Chlamydomonas_euryale.AAC.2
MLRVVFSTPDWKLCFRQPDHLIEAYMCCNCRHDADRPVQRAQAHRPVSAHTCATGRCPQAGLRAPDATPRQPHLKWRTAAAGGQLLPQRRQRRCHPHRVGLTTLPEAAEMVEERCAHGRGWCLQHVRLRPCAGAAHRLEHVGATQQQHARLARWLLPLDSRSRRATVRRLRHRGGAARSFGLLATAGIVAALAHNAGVQLCTHMTQHFERACVALLLRLPVVHHHANADAAAAHLAALGRRRRSGRSLAAHFEPVGRRREAWLPVCVVHR